MRKFEYVTATLSAATASTMMPRAHAPTLWSSSFEPISESPSRARSTTRVKRGRRSHVSAKAKRGKRSPR